MPVELRSGPAQITIDPAGTPLVITQDQQFQDAKLSVSQDTFELKTQLSSKARAYKITGVEFMLTVSLADVSLATIGVAFGIAVTTGTGVNSGKKAVVVTDRAGTTIAGKKVLVKPYIGLTVDSNAENWLTFPNGIIKDPNGTELGFGLATQQNLQIMFVSMPDADGVRAIFGDELALV